MNSSEILSSKEKRTAFVKDCTQLIMEELSQKKGITGMTIKTVFALVQKMKPNMLEELVDMLLPEFIKAVDPIVQAFQNSKVKDFPEYMKQRSSDLVQALLKVTDNKAAVAKNQALKSGYKKLRGLAEKQVTEAIPRISAMLSKYLPNNK